MRARQIKFFQNDRKTKGNDPTHILMDDPLMHLLLLQQPKITEQGQTNPIQFNSIQQQVIMPSEDQLKEWKELYECFDKDKDGNDKGYMEPKDCWVALRMLGFNPSEKDLEGFSKEIGKKKYQFEDLVKAIDLAGKRDRDTVDEIMEAFRIFDKDGNGYISIPELRNIYCNMGEKFSDEEFEDMRKSIDDGSGMVAYEDFVKMILA